MTLSTDGTADAAEMADYVAAQYLVLADPQSSTARDYGVYNLLNDGVAAPATFIIAKDGTILWSLVGQNVSDRPSASEILARLDQLVE